MPVILGYTKGHFSALVPIKPLRVGAGTSSAASATSEDLAKSSTSGRQEREDDSAASNEGDVSQKDRCIYLPLFDVHGGPMAVPFAPKSTSVS